jgi:hypothetical protein
MTAKNKTGGAEPSATPVFDLAGFDLQADAERGTMLQVRNPRTGEVTGATIQVIGSDARAYRVALRRIRDAAAAAPEREPTDEDDALLLGRARTAAAAVTAWDGMSLKGEALACTAEKAIEVFTTYPWLADQVLTFVNNRGNFAPA